MRIEKYIKESVIEWPWYQKRIDDYGLWPADKVIKTLKSDCSKYIGEIKGTTPFWRGFSSYKTIKDIDIKSVTPRTERRPMDTSKEWTKYADDYFESRFGWRPRTQGVFGIRMFAAARGYGRAFMMFPIGSYDYIWSPKVDDFWVLYDERKKNYIFPSELESFYSMMDYNKYTQKNINKAGKDHEVMFRVKAYHIVNPVYWPWVYEMLGSKMPTNMEQGSMESFIAGFMP